MEKCEEIEIPSQTKGVEAANRASVGGLSNSHVLPEYELHGYLQDLTWTGLLNKL